MKHQSHHSSVYDRIETFEDVLGIKVDERNTLICSRGGCHPAKGLCVHGINGVQD